MRRSAIVAIEEMDCWIIWGMYLAASCVAAIWQFQSVLELQSTFSNEGFIPATA